MSENETEYRAIPKKVVNELTRSRRLTFERFMMCAFILMVFLMWLDSYYWRLDANRWMAEHELTLVTQTKMIEQNARMLTRILETQEDVVNVMADFPPHRHQGNQVVYPNRLPHLRAKSSEDPDPQR